MAHTFVLAHTFVMAHSFHRRLSAKCPVRMPPGVCVCVCVSKCVGEQHTYEMFEQHTYEMLAKTAT